MAEVAESEGGAAEVLESAVDGLGGSVGGAGPVEVGQDVTGSSGEGPAECAELVQGGGDPGGERVDELAHGRLSARFVGVAVGGDHVLVDGPGRLDGDVGVAVEQGGQALGLLLGEQVGAGVQGSPGGVERVARAAPVPAGVLLDAAPAAIEGVSGETDNVEGVHDGDRGGQLLGGGRLEAGEAIHRDDLHRVAPGLRAVGEPGLERLFRAALDHVEQPGRAGPITDRGEIDDHCDVLVPTAGVPPDMLVNPEDLHAVEAGRVIDQDPAPFGQDRGVGGVPRDPEPLGDAGDRQVLAHDALQRPAQAPAGDLRPRLRSLRGVLAPHVPAPGAPVPANPDEQRRGTPAQRLVRQAPGNSVTRSTLAPAPPAPPVGLDDPALQHRPTGLEVLADDLQAKPVQTSERSQVRTSEGSVRHVEVFRMGGVGTSIIGRPRPLPGPRHAASRCSPSRQSLYTLNCEEPLMVCRVDAIVSVRVPVP